MYKLLKMKKGNLSTPLLVELLICLFAEEAGEERSDYGVDANYP